MLTMAAHKLKSSLLYAGLEDWAELAKMIESDQRSGDFTIEDYVVKLYEGLRLFRVQGR